MITCYTCKREQEDIEFTIKNKKTGNRRTTCKACQRDYSQKHYKKNAIKYIKKSKKVIFSVDNPVFCGIILSRLRNTNEVGRKLLFG